jgi:hypothetical protein
MDHFRATATTARFFALSTGGDGRVLQLDAKFYF